MITHIVIFKLKDKSKIEEAKQVLQSMDGKIEVLKLLEVGENIIDAPRNYDLSVYTKFETLEDLNIYADHPVHVKVKEYLNTVVEKTAVIDYKE